MKVQNMENSNGNIVKNQFIITDANARKKTFQSYDSQILDYYENNNNLVVYPEWDYSKTTMRYVKQFINEETCYTYEDKKQFKKLITENDNIIVM